MERKYHQSIARIAGSINADFLPLISARNDFVVHSQEYKLFYQLMRAQLEKILIELKNQSETKNFQKVNQELQEVMKQIKEALLMNPDFIPQGKAVARLNKQARQAKAARQNDFVGLVASAFIKEKKDDQSVKKASSDQEKNYSAEVKDDAKKELETKPKIDAKPLVVKRIKLKKLGISCGIVSLGQDGPEALSQGNLIYINQDKPLYQKFYKKRDPLGLHLMRLITQEIVLMKKSRLSAADAFSWQGKFLQDALGK